MKRLILAIGTLCALVILARCEAARKITPDDVLNLIPEGEVDPGPRPEQSAEIEKWAARKKSMGEFHIANPARSIAALGRDAIPAIKELMQNFAMDRQSHYKQIRVIKQACDQLDINTDPIKSCFYKYLQDTKQTRRSEQGVVTQFICDHANDTDFLKLFGILWTEHPAVVAKILDLGGTEGRTKLAAWSGRTDIITIDTLKTGEIPKNDEISTAFLAYIKAALAEFVPSTNL